MRVPDLFEVSGVEVRVADLAIRGRLLGRLLAEVRLQQLLAGIRK